jgi:hypothetical protein
MRQHSVMWVQLTKFCELTGYTRDAIYAKMRRGVWAQGVHWRKAPDGHIMVNIEEYHRWIESAA